MKITLSHFSGKELFVTFSPDAFKWLTIFWILVENLSIILLSFSSYSQNLCANSGDAQTWPCLNLDKCFEAGIMLLLYSCNFQYSEKYFSAIASVYNKLHEHPSCTVILICFVYLESCQQHSVILQSHSSGSKHLQSVRIAFIWIH